MASGGGSDSKDGRLEVAKVSQSLFGVDFTPEQIVTDTLERAAPAIDTAGATVRDATRAAVASDDGPPTDYEAFRGYPLASWIESTFGVREEAGTGKLLRHVPRWLGASRSAWRATGTVVHSAGQGIRHPMRQGTAERRAGRGSAERHHGSLGAHRRRPRSLRRGPP